MTSVLTRKPTPKPTHTVTAQSKIRQFFSFRNFSALWVFAVIFVIFAFTIPQTFLAPGNWVSLLDAQVVVAVATISIVITLAAGVFNLAIGVQVGTASIMSAWLIVPLGLPIPVAIVITLLASGLIGLLTGWIIVRFHISSFIATLGVSSLLTALIAIMSGSRQILGMPEAMQEFGTGKLFGITYPFYVMLAIAAAAWYVLERTSLGRKVYAVGGNSEAARLSGINSGAVVIGVLTVSGVIAGVAGVLLTTRLGNADPTIGGAYLLPVFTAAFLGSTQFKGGRFNIWGSILAVYVLAVGIKGLQLSGAAGWIADAFNGTALLVAVGLASSAHLSKNKKSRFALWRRKDRQISHDAPSQ